MTGVTVDSVNLTTDVVFDDQVTSVSIMSDALAAGGYPVESAIFINGSPTADAGVDIFTVEGNSVTLDGSLSSDPDDDPLTYQWVQVSGPAVSLIDSATPNPGFTVPFIDSKSETMVFRLTVWDSMNMESTDDVSVFVSNMEMTVHSDIDPASAKEMIDSGFFQMIIDVRGESDYCGSGGHIPGAVNYPFSNGSFSEPIPQIDPATRILIVCKTGMTSHSAASLLDQNGFSSVYDMTGGMNAWTFETVSCQTSVFPVAMAGEDRKVMEGVTVTLDGSGSSAPDSEIASFFWTQTGGPSVVLSDSSGMKPTFVSPGVDNSGRTLTFTLTVTNREGLSTSDDVTVSVSDNGVTGFDLDCIPFISSTGFSLGIQVEDGDIVSIFPVDPNTLPDNASAPDDMPYGLLDTVILVNGPGEDTVLVVNAQAPIPDAYKWFRHESGSGWIQMDQEVSFSAERKQVRIKVTDGGIGDADKSTNGMIRITSGPGLKVSGSQPDDSGGPGPGGCFIRTLFGK